jgi:AraC family transcriptional regulator
MSSLNLNEILPKDFYPSQLDCRNYISSPTIKIGSKLRERKIRKYEFELFLGTEGKVFIDNSLIPITEGDIIFKKPGQTTYGIAPHKSLIVFFNILENYDNKNQCVISKDKEFGRFSILEKIPSISHPEPTEAYKQLFYNILNEYVNASYASPLLLNSYLLQLIYNIYSWHTELSNKTVLPDSPYYVPIKKVIQYIQHNYALKIDLKTLSYIGNLSPSHFHKIFTQIMNMTPCEYIIQVRIDMAKEFLLKSNMSIQQIADSSGFGNSSYFSEAFRKATNLSPRDFRKKYSLSS